MIQTWHLDRLSEADLPTLAGLLAFWLRPGDVVLLRGEIGAGKTTFARQLIRAALETDDAEVPSPTFALVQGYETPRLTLTHADLYRMGDAAEIGELGLEDAWRAGAVIVEWPERAEAAWPGDRLDLTLAETGAADTRAISLDGHGAWAPRLDRLAAAHGMIVAWDRAARVSYLLGDASPRRYARLAGVAGTRLLMDAPRQPDGPAIRDGLPYSRIAHLAEDVRPFVAIGGALRDAGLSAPEIFAHDLDRGLLLIEDFGPAVFGALVAETRAGRGGPSQDALWTAATDALAELRRAPPPEMLALSDGGRHVIPPYDAGALSIEVSLLADWYWPHAHEGAGMPADVRAAFDAAWRPILAVLGADTSGWVLRDVHSPNLIWLPERMGAQRVGLIDFQDAMRGSPAYDLVSLLQDARLDVPVDLERPLLDRYCARAAREDGAFDEAGFRFAYAALGAQRNTKILGIFARLARRDGKPQYLGHMPRIWGYLGRCLAFPGLETLAAWYEHHVPAAVGGSGG